MTNERYDVVVAGAGNAALCAAMAADEGASHVTISCAGSTPAWRNSRGFGYADTDRGGNREVG